MSAGFLAPSELQAAETAIVGFVQRKHFKEELTALESKGAVVKKSSIYLLEPFLDEEGILRVAGSLRNAPPPEKVGTQLSCLRITMCRNLLVVRRARELQSGHCGKEYVLALIR